jgi:hypothetical protein
MARNVDAVGLVVVVVTAPGYGPALLVAAAPSRPEQTAEPSG